MGHLNMIGYLVAVLIVVYLVYRNSKKIKDDEKELE